MPITYCVPLGKRSIKHYAARCDRCGVHYALTVPNLTTLINQFFAVGWSTQLPRPSRHYSQYTVYCYPCTKARHQQNATGDTP